MQKSNNNREVFSPLQISIGSFFGGPIAAVYLIRENFRAMEMESQPSRARSVSHAVWRWIEVATSTMDVLRH